MRLASWIAFVLFAFAVVVQTNDPDPAIWILAYGIAAASAFASGRGRYFPRASAIASALYLFFAWREAPGNAGGAAASAFSSFGMASLDIEEVRESLGLAICGLWMAVLAAVGCARRSARPLAARTAPFVLCVVLLFAGGCAAQTAQTARTARTARPSGASGPVVGADAVAVPLAPAKQLVPRVRVADHLENPRGMLARAGDALLVSVAGTGDPAKPATGALLRLEDENGDGRFDGPGERRELLNGRESKNIVDIVRRDEVFGMAGMAEGDGTTLVSLAYFGGPSTIYRVDGGKVREWSRVYGNINDVAFDPKRGIWLGVSSSSDEVVQLQPERGSRRIVKLPPLPRGQDAVPGYLRHDPRSGDVLVTLFSGSTEGEEGGEGTELEPRAGGVVRVDPDSGEMRWLVTGLTAPTDLEIGPDGRLYVLEFCSDFADPIRDRAALWSEPSHGGFRRFSGRLLSIDPDTGEVVVLAEGLDGPTNLALRGRELFIAQGMGTPGRPIPGPEGTVPLTGFIDKLVLPETSRAGAGDRRA